MFAIRQVKMIIQIKNNPSFKEKSFIEILFFTFQQHFKVFSRKIFKNKPEKNIICFTHFYQIYTSHTKINYFCFANFIRDSNDRTMWPLSLVEKNCKILAIISKVLYYTWAFNKYLYEGYSLDWIKMAEWIWPKLVNMTKKLTTMNVNFWTWPKI